MYGDPYEASDLAALATDGNLSTCAKSAVDVYDGLQEYRIELDSHYAIDSLILHLNTSEQGNHEFIYML